MKLTIDIPAELLTKLQEEALVTGTSVEALIRQAIRVKYTTTGNPARENGYEAPIAKQLESV